MVNSWLVASAVYLSTKGIRSTGKVRKVIRIYKLYRIIGYRAYSCLIYRLR